MRILITPSILILTALLVACGNEGTDEANEPVTVVTDSLDSARIVVDDDTVYLYWVTILDRNQDGKSEARTLRILAPGSWRNDSLVVEILDREGTTGLRIAGRVMTDELSASLHTPATGSWDVRIVDRAGTNRPIVVDASDLSMLRNLPFETTVYSTMDTNSSSVVTMLDSAHWSGLFSIADTSTLWELDLQGRGNFVLQSTQQLGVDCSSREREEGSWAQNATGDTLRLSSNVQQSSIGCLGFWNPAQNVNLRRDIPMQLDTNQSQALLFIDAVGEWIPFSGP